MGEIIPPENEDRTESADPKDEKDNKEETVEESTKTNNNAEENAEGEEGGVLEIETHHSEDEVVDRLFNAEFDVRKEVQSIWGWASSVADSVSSVSNSVQETVKASTEELNKKVEELNIQDAVNKVSESVLEATESIKANVSKLNEEEAEAEAVREKGAKEKSDRLLYPWEPKTRFSSEIRERVMRLSEDNNTFIIPPPEQVQFKLDLTENIADGAKLMLKVDKNLSKKRFELVPRQIDENTFWVNYFYRVELVKRSYGVDESINQQYNSDELKPRTDTDAGDSGIAQETDEFSAESKGTAQKRKDTINSASWEDELRAELDEDANFDMFDDDELLAAVDADGNDDDDFDVDVDDDDDDDDLGLEERIKAELNLSS